ncbi:hypothetical protein BFP70_06845 [Thioclava sp. SK-1]|uniref:WGR domain-containing protein n=1 Tax=Thioclava sp. SK-1 TaxID=1889770 RepID=UPI00082607F3|nr:WGR domain-containing protein [Thioclava sp. SK-1]OCX66167.1 hypothetical protein BFP70_06845 [Thioclava sp. SK-1]
MLTMILHRGAARRFYRVEVTYNLFGEYTVLREWGQSGRSTGMRKVWFGNLRDAVQAADNWNRRAQRRGYDLTETAAFGG